MYWPRLLAPAASRPGRVSTNLRMPPVMEGCWPVSLAGSSPRNWDSASATSSCPRATAYLAGSAEVEPAPGSGVDDLFRSSSAVEKCRVVPVTVLFRSISI